MRFSLQTAILAATAMLLLLLLGVGTYYRRVVAPTRGGTFATNDSHRRHEVLNRASITLWLGLAWLTTCCLSWECATTQVWPHLSLSYLLGWAESLDRVTPILPDRGLGEWLGYTGSGLMLIALLYNHRSINSRLHSKFSKKLWLDFHIFCGVLGPILITFHSAFRLGGLVAISYWAMAVVFVSGLIGRYVWVQIPRDMEGQILRRSVVQSQITAATRALAGVIDPQALATLLRLQEQRLDPDAGWFATLRHTIVSDLRGWWHEQILGIELRFHVDRQARRQFLAAYRARRLLLRRSRSVSATRRLLSHWTRLHKPLANVMVTFAILHIVAALLFRVEN